MSLLEPALWNYHGALKMAQKYIEKEHARSNVGHLQCAKVLMKLGEELHGKNSPELALAKARKNEPTFEAQILPEFALFPKHYGKLKATRKLEKRLDLLKTKATSQQSEAGKAGGQAFPAPARCTVSSQYRAKEIA
jgi:hypothetical protein